MKGDDCMFLFTVLLIILTLLVVVAAVLLALGGTVFTVVFGDILVCIFIIVMIIKFAFGRKKK